MLLWKPYTYCSCPSNFNGNNNNANVFFVYGASNPGYLTDGWVISSYAVRPVVTLKSSVLVSGSGTASDPYIPESGGAGTSDW